VPPGPFNFLEAIGTLDAAKCYKTRRLPWHRDEVTFLHGQAECVQLSSAILDSALTGTSVTPADDRNDVLSRLSGAEIGDIVEADDREAVLN
jgi:hypothetical protein